MINFKIFKTSCEFSFGFFALFAILFYCNNQSDILTAIICCLLHEMGHLISMIIFKSSPQKIIFYGGGIKIIPNTRILKKNNEIAILLSGCILNFILALICTKVHIFSQFVAINIIIGAFNLLPFKAFDGGQVLEKLFCENENSKLIGVYHGLRTCLCVLIVLFGLYISMIYGLNLSLIVTICYIILSELFIE